MYIIFLSIFILSISATKKDSVQAEAKEEVKEEHCLDLSKEK